MNITLRHLEVFSAIASNANVTRAAEQLLMTQSAASMALADFEKHLGCRLFSRKGKRLILNEQGRALLPKVLEVLDRVNEIENEFSGQSAQAGGVIKVGASSTIGNYLIPALLGGFAKEYPSVTVSLEVANTEQIIGSLLRCDTDIAFIEGLCRHPEIHSTVWRTDQLVIFASPDHPLASRKSVTVDDLAASRWILREKGSGTRDIFEKALAGKLDNLDIAFELGHTEAIKNAVSNNLGISCLSRMTVARSLEDGSLVELVTPFLNLERNFYRLILRGKYITSILKSFMEFCG